MPKVQIGSVIAGRYRLVAPLSRGGMGSVWRAEHMSLGSPIAIKLIDAELVEQEELRARFEQEARAAAALRSPHVVQILDHGVDRGLPFIAMELLEGESLAARIERERALAPAKVARIFQDVGRAVRRAHDLGIVHRDLKPDNIFLVRNDDQEVAKILDFGIAKAQNPFGSWKGGTRTGALIGTPQYMSPEQAQGYPVDKATDLWALGVIAFECVCGRLPFPSENPGELIMQICAKAIPVPSHVARVPPRFDAWFARACQRDATQRFASAKELCDALSEVLGGAAEQSGAHSALGSAGAVSAMMYAPQVAPAVSPVMLGQVAPGPGAAGPGVARAITGLEDLAPTEAIHRSQLPGGRAAPVGPSGTHVPVAPQPLPELKLHATTMSGGAVMDSDPGTLVMSPRSRSKRLAIGVAIAAAVVVGLGVWLAVGRGGGETAATPESGSASPAQGAGAPADGPLTGDPAATSPQVTPSGTALSPGTAAAPSTTGSAKAPVVVGAGGGTAGARPTAGASAKPTTSTAPTASGKKPDRIGF